MGRRATTLVAGLALTACIGVVETGVTPAATPDNLKIQPRSVWTAFAAQAFCEVVTFRANGTFTSQDGPGGTWSGGGKTLSMTWPGPPNPSLTFNGTFMRSEFKEYVGTFNGVSSGEVVKGTGHGC